LLIVWQGFNSTKQFFAKFLTHSPIIPRKYGNIIQVSTKHKSTMFCQKPILFSSFLVIALLITGCGRTAVSVDNPSVGSVNTLEEKPKDIADWIAAEEIMALALADNKETLYVAEAFRGEVQEELNAEIKDNIWTYQNSRGVMENRREQPLKNVNSSTVAIVEWVYARGYTCVEKEAGYILPIHRVGDASRKLIAGYETTEPAKWCEDNRYGRCKFIWKDVTSRFIKVRNGKLLTRRGEYVLTDTTTLRIMSCVD
jgi:hypothetical protein